MANFRNSKSTLVLGLIVHVLSCAQTRKTAKRMGPLQDSLESNRLERMQRNRLMLARLGIPSKEVDKASPLKETSEEDDSHDKKEENELLISEDMMLVPNAFMHSNMQIDAYKRILLFLHSQGALNLTQMCLSQNKKLLPVRVIEFIVQMWPKIKEDLLLNDEIPSRIRDIEKYSTHIIQVLKDVQKTYEDKRKNIRERLKREEELESQKLIRPVRNTDSTLAQSPLTQTSETSSEYSSAEPNPNPNHNPDSDVVSDPVDISLAPLAVNPGNPGNPGGKVASKDFGKMEASPDNSEVSRTAVGQLGDESSDEKNTQRLYVARHARCYKCKEDHEFDRHLGKIEICDLCANAHRKFCRRGL